MANYWADRSWSIALITLSDSSSDFYRLSPNVKRIGMGLLRRSEGRLSGMARNMERILVLRTTLKKLSPKVVISFQDSSNVLTLLATLGMNCRVVISERSDPSCHNIGKVWNRIRRMVYPLADVVICQNEAVRKWMHAIVDASKVHVIPNPIVAPAETLQGSLAIRDLCPGIETSDRIVLGIGRLSEEKGFDLLIQAFRLATQGISGWTLVILGEGQLREQLISQAYGLGLQRKVHFPGLVKYPANLMKQADLFVLSSRYEGFPNVLCEAMACGLPAISFDCPSGPREIIREGVNGLLVPPGDIDALAQRMSRLMGDEGERQRLAFRGPEVLDRYSLPRIMGIWEALLEDARK